MRHIAYLCDLLWCYDISTVSEISCYLLVICLLSQVKGDTITCNSRYVIKH